MWANDLTRAGDRKRGSREWNVQAVDYIILYVQSKSNRFFCRLSLNTKSVDS